MSHLILSSSAAVPRAERESLIRGLLEPFGAVGRILCVDRNPGPSPRPDGASAWVALAEFSGDTRAVLAGLRNARLDGSTVRIRTATPLEVTRLGGVTV